ncbi:MAG: excinuclease ABC subunit UvrA [Clostridia bacterium]|nr:excinuclease ABC subunit UvrA [Clostridia bacterium]
MRNNDIIIKGAKENNLKNISVTIPRDKLVVFTGLSGSGKSSLAFDTIFAEGQRRYMESLSSYARMFLGQMEKPNVESIEGLSPAISIDQKTTSKNPRSTVGTVTEIHDYLRLLYARTGVPHCPKCGKEIKNVSIDQINAKIMEASKGAKVIVMAPVVRGRKGEYQKQLEGYRKQGFLRVKIDGEVRLLEEDIKLDKQIKHNISIVVDRLIVKDDMSRRLTDSVEQALKLAEGMVLVDIDGVETLYSTNYACPDCDITMPELTPRMFSFNSPFGACPECFGLGMKHEVEPSLVVRDENLTLREGAIRVGGWNIMDMGKMMTRQIEAVSKKYGFSMDMPFKDLSPEAKNIIFYGTGDDTIEMDWQTRKFTTTYNAPFEGVINNLNRRYRETQSEGVKRDLERYMAFTPCKLCGGKRLRQDVLGVTVGGLNIAELSDLSVLKLVTFFDELKLGERESIIAMPILKEIKARLNFLKNVGLGYLTLSRGAATLSGGESQRIRLATQIGSGLMGVLYILDEPSIGLHQSDNRKLLNALQNLRNLGNTLIVVEHDEDTIRCADHIVDIGPRAGEKGGELVAEGTISDIINCPESITGDYLAGRREIKIPSTRRQGTGGYLEVRGARQNNLKNITVRFPAGKITAVTGVSGSGKSSLVNGILYPRLANELNGAEQYESKNYDEIVGIENFDKVIQIDQSPIGRTPRSNPATYTDVFTPIRNLFAQTPDAKARGYTASRFSFNVSGGRCESCKGDGILKIEMHFLPDVYVPCEVCHGKRYTQETLEVKYKGKSIFDVLDMTVDTAVEFFRNIPTIYPKLKCLQDVGLGYIKLGQPSTTLSGGEAQRVKLATELSKRNTGKTLYILDEPTTGLHMYDVEKLIGILDRLADNGNTIIVIEHNLDIIKVADHIIDLGPEGGDEGGQIVAVGTPEEVAKVDESKTGEFLKNLLKNATF